VETFILPETTSGVCSFTPSQVVLAAHTTEAYFRTTPLGSTCAISTPNAGFNWYRLAAPCLIDGDLFVVSLCFALGSLSSLSISMSVGQADPSWSTWSESDELAKNLRHQAILQRHYGPGPAPYKFAWGEVDASYDPRGGASTIAIRYQ
jgi:hypothetical protein